MPEWLEQILIMSYFVATVLSVIYPIAMSDEIDKYVGVSTSTDLALCSIVIMIGTITLGCIPYAFFYYLYFKKKKRIYEEKKEKENKERLERELVFEKYQEEYYKSVLEELGIPVEEYHNIFGKECVND